MIDRAWSDHREIEVICVGKEVKRGNRNNMVEGKWNWRKADWAVMAEVVRNEVRMVSWNEMGVEEMAKKLQDVIISACNRCVERTNGSEKQVSWWCRELEEMRREVRRKRRNWIRYREDADRRLFRVCLLRYKKRIWERKREVWEMELIKMNDVDVFGKAYQILSKGERSEVVLSTMRKADGVWTEGVEDTMKYILDEMLPDDVAEEDSVVQAECREEVLEIVTRVDDEVLNVAEVEILVKKAISKFKNKKAPGWDGVKAEVLKCVSGSLIGVMAKIMIQMRVEGVFPDLWKRGVLRLIKKAIEKPNEEIKSFRPVTLLPVLGKLAERVMARWLTEEVEGKMNERQYGFREGMGTVDALKRLKNVVEASRKGYVCGIFADIKGAFDNAWHPAILKQLYLWDCSPGLIRLVGSYLKDRRVMLTVGGGVAEKVVTKGCPQGSILGPLLWNVLFNGLLELDMGGVEIVAYADDAVIIVDADTRNDVERRLVDVAERLWSWTDSIKLKLSLEKTVVMKLKENKINSGKAQKKSDKKRKLVVRVRGRRLENVTEVKYLGVWIGEGMKCDRHVAEIGTKVIDLVSMFAREMRVEWGLTSKTLYKLYRLVIQPGMLYGVEFWGEEMLRRRLIRDRWNAVQRKVVMKMIRAYRTVSGDAVCVVAGVVVSTHFSF